MTEFSVERKVDAPVQLVWRAWTTPEGLATWWWPQLPDTTYEIDARVGGSYLFESKSAGIGARGKFAAVEEPIRLEMSWWWIGGAVADVPDLVRVDFEPNGSSTLVRVTHRVNATDDSGTGLQQGWNDVLDRLTELL